MNNRCPDCDARYEVEGHLFSCQRDRAETAEHERDTANRANEALRARVGELETALLACEHAAITAEDPKDMQDEVVAHVERVLGKPPRASHPISTVQK